MNKKDFYALVTGGTTGIGAATSKCLRDNGYNVIASYPPSNSIASKKFSQNENINIIEFDASNFSETESAIDNIQKKYGFIGVLVNNAGVTSDKFFHKMTPEQFINVININLLSVFNCTKSVINEMRNNQFGRIISMSSVNALKGEIGQTNYCASKAAILGFSKALAQENAKKGITVNCIAPGYVNTTMTQNIDSDVMNNYILPQIPQGRLGIPDEIANLIKFIISNDASYITGQTFSINGGQFMN